LTETVIISPQGSPGEDRGVLWFNLLGGVNDGVTDNAAALEAAMATAAAQRRTLNFMRGRYFVSRPPGVVVNAALHDCAEVNYDWISWAAIGGEVVFVSPEIVSTFPGVVGGVPTTITSGQSRAILKANSLTGGTFQLTGLFAFDGGTPTTGNAQTWPDPKCQCPLEVRGYDLVQFDTIAFRNCRSNWDTRSNPGAVWNYGDGAGPVSVYNPAVEPTCLNRRSTCLFDDNGFVYGRLICEQNAREGPFVTQSNIFRYILFQYHGPSDPAVAVSSPINPSGRFFGTDANRTVYGCDKRDKATVIVVEEVTGAWRGSFANVGWSGECTINQLCPITGAVPPTGVDTTTTSTLAHSPGWDFGAEVNPDPSGPLHLNGVWMVNNHRYSVYLTRTVGVNEIELVDGDITVDGGWWGPRLIGVKTTALKIRTRNIVRYFTGVPADPTNVPYGSALTIENCGGGWIEIDAEGELTVPGSVADPTTRRSYYGVFKERSDGIRISGRVKDFAFRLYSGDDDTGITDNERVHLFGPMEFVAETYTVGTDGQKLVKLGRSTKGRIKRAELAGVRYNGQFLFGQGVADIYAYDLPGGSRLRLGASTVELANDRFGVFEFASDDPSSPGAGVKARLFALSDANGRDGELYTEIIDRVAGDVFFERKLYAHMVRNAGGTSYYPGKGFSIGASTAAMVADTLYLVPYDEDVLSSALAINVTVGGGNCRLGLYGSDRNGKELSLIEDLGGRSVSGVALTEWPWAGTYRRLGGPMWLAAVFSGTPTISTFIANVDLHVRHGSSSLSSTSVRTHRTAALTYGALPTTPPTMAWASSGCPAIGVKGG